ncbi:MAG: adenylosuccinate lyase [Bdellovibrio sp.]|nr:MAG: adenylosuccinate lyase [Bdellovibrio sp.]
MVERYTRPEMGRIWSEQNKFETMKQVEVVVAQVQAEKGLIPQSAARNIARKAKFQISRIKKIEEKTKHDVIAFVSNLAENVGKDGRFIHFGLTSSDVLDTALALQIKQAGKIIKDDFKVLKRVLREKIRTHEKTVCVGRTHGIHAEPMSFGLKMAGFYEELKRNEKRFLEAWSEACVGKLSGAVGTYSALDESIEKKVCQKLGLKREDIATQVIPRDRHAYLMIALSMIGSGLERLAVELRHLQRTEVYEVVEGFSKGQKGSSAMPHKKNPISAENITGCARLLRAYAQAAQENIVLWHERDISHSSVERVIFPDAFILCDYAMNRMASLIKNLVVDKERMLKNFQFSQGQLFSSHLLLALVKKGLSREEAYKLVQRLSHSLEEGDDLLTAALRDKMVSKHLKESELRNIFSGKAHQKSISKIIQRSLKS